LMPCGTASCPKTCLRILTGIPEVIMPIWPGTSIPRLCLSNWIESAPEPYCRCRINGLIRVLAPGPLSAPRG
jgi:hypothetical protein